MKKIESGRLAWSKPELRRMKAGSAEAGNNTASDGGGPAPNKTS